MADVFLSRRAILAATLIAFAVALIALIPRLGTPPTTPPLLTPVAGGESAPTEEAYEQVVAAALEEFVRGRATWPAELDEARAALELPALRAARNRLAEVVVPASRREEHLSLALALAQIAQGITDRNLALWEKGERGLDKYLESK